MLSKKLKNELTDLDKIGDFLLTGEPVVPEVGKITGGRYFKKGNETFKLNDMIKLIFNQGKKSPEVNIDELYQKIKMLDKEGETKLNKKGFFIRLITKLKRMFSKVGFNKKSTFKKIENIYIEYIKNHTLTHLEIKTHSSKLTEIQLRKLEQLNKKKYHFSLNQLQTNMSGFGYIVGLKKTESLYVDGKSLIIQGKYSARKHLIPQLLNKMHMFLKGQGSKRTIKAIQALSTSTKASLIDKTAPIVDIGIELPIKRELLYNLEEAISSINSSDFLGRMKKDSDIKKISSITRELQGLVKNVKERIDYITNDPKYLEWEKSQESMIGHLIKPGAMIQEEKKRASKQSAIEDTPIIQPVYEKFYPFKLIEKQLTQLYGEPLVSYVFKKYGIQKSCDISHDLLSACLKGMAANINKNELIKLLKNNPSDFAGSFSQSIRKGATDGTITEEELGQAVIELRSFYDELKPVIRPSYPFISQIQNDNDFLKLAGWINHYKFERSKDSSLNHVDKFSYAEFIARDLIYGLYANHGGGGFNDRNSSVNLREGILAPIWDHESKTIKCKEVHHLISDNGLHGAAFTSAIVNKGDKVEVQIAFRGTYDFESAVRDLDPRENELKFFEGPGAKSFNDNQALLMDAIDKVVKKTQEQAGVKEVYFSTLGHSLGATDAQRTTQLIHQIYHNRGWMKQLKEINLYAFNAPGLEPIVNKTLNLTLEENKKLKDPELAYLCQINLRYFKMGEDMIQLGGQEMLGANIKPEHKNVTASIFRFDIPGKSKIFTNNDWWIVRYLKNKLNAHTLHIMTKSFDEEHLIPNTTKLSEVVTTNPKDFLVKKDFDAKAPHTISERIRKKVNHCLHPRRARV